MIKESLKEVDPNECVIDVVGFDNLLVDHAKKSGAKVIIRGLGQLRILVYFKWAE